MQNLPLPSLNASQAAAPKSSGSPAAASSNDAFKQALSQQLEQRQTLKNNAEARLAERQAASRATAPRPAQNAKPAQPQQAEAADKSAQPKPAEQPKQQADNAADTEVAAQPVNPGQVETSSDAEAARAADPVADMLAVMAAFNQQAAAGANAADGTDGADGAAIDPAVVAARQDAASNAVDAATLRALTAAEAGAAAKADSADISEPAARFNGAEFKAALGRAAADALPVQNAEAAQVTAVDGKLKPGLAELAGLHGAASAAADASTGTGADTTVRPDAKADLANFGQQLNATRERQAEAVSGARTDARAEAEALAAKDTALAATAPATVAAGAPEMAKAVAPATTLYSRVGTAAWDQQLGQKVIFMAAGGEQSATMELNPPDLGPLQVVLSVSKDQATAAFTSAAPEVRQALEAALPKLREMMGEAGIQLGNATVSAGTSDQNNSSQASSSGSGQRGVHGRNGAGASDGADAPPATATVRRLPSSAVDTFA
jgi:flagellar hook-length control protein FliK